ncbi:MAG: MarC family protein [Dehalococcoidia bacterium]|nr:MarC family protein [Dehalococcoidia bacterium]
MEELADFFNNLLFAFIPIFIAMDAVGVLPILLGLSESMMAKERTRMVRYAMLTALGLGLGFIAVGKLVFILMGIEVADFLVAGGLVLFILAARELITERREIPADGEMIGIVPLGTPLIVGPAVLTTLLLLIDRYEGALGITAVIIAFIANLTIAWLIFAQGNRIASFLGRGGLRAASKIAMLLLTAIAVMMIREGVTQILETL